MSPLSHDAVDKPRKFYTLLDAHQQHYKHHSDSGQHVSSVPNIARDVPAVCVLKVGAFNII
jgi:hypothetical protein